MTAEVRKSTVCTLSHTCKTLKENLLSNMYTFFLPLWKHALQKPTSLHDGHTDKMLMCLCVCSATVESARH